MPTLNCLGIFKGYNLDYENYLIFRKNQSMIDPKYKTELCSKFISEGHCSYFSKCRFAHGISDLIAKQRDVKSKAECQSYSKTGFCKFGDKCELTHYKVGYECNKQKINEISQILNYNLKVGRLRVFTEINLNELKPSSRSSVEFSVDAELNSTTDDQ